MIQIQEHLIMSNVSHNIRIYNVTMCWDFNALTHPTFDVFNVMWFGSEFYWFRLVTLTHVDTLFQSQNWHLNMHTYYNMCKFGNRALNCQNWLNVQSITNKLALNFSCIKTMWQKSIELSVCVVCFCCFVYIFFCFYIQ